ncbi:MAG TPA: hypothetical protein VHM90_03700, partial [Phycisphaerae bacterium]|nr:hypothetical protein [Phycisphaerae bacterium]
MKRFSTADVNRRLQDEARALRLRPQYSPLVHQRMMAALQQRGLPAESSYKGPESLRLWKIGIPLGIAAALAAAAWISLQPREHAQPAPKIADNPPPPQPTTIARQSPPDSTDIATATLDRGKFAYL